MPKKSGDTPLYEAPGDTPSSYSRIMGGIQRPAAVPGQTPDPIIPFPFERYPNLVPLRDIINPTRKDGQCFRAHQEVHNFLVLGETPKNVQVDFDRTKQGRRIEGEDGEPLIYTAVSDFWATIQDLIEAEDNNGAVYAVDAEDHAFNLLKLDGNLYLIDASFGVFRQIKKPSDFTYSANDRPATPDAEVFSLLDDFDDFSIVHLGFINPDVVAGKTADSTSAAASAEPPAVLANEERSYKAPGQ